MVSKFLSIPLMILLCVSVFAFLYHEDVPAGFGEGTLSLKSADANSDVAYFDIGGHGLLYDNGTFVGEPGYIYEDNIPYYSLGYGDKFWKNSTGTYQMYDNPDAAPLKDSTASWNWLATGTLGFLGIVGGLMFLATIVGLRILGFGISETSVSTLMKGTAYLSLFLLASAFSAAEITAVPIFGWIFYFLLTAVYTLGLLGTIGTVGGAD